MQLGSAAPSDDHATPAAGVGEWESRRTITRNGDASRRDQRNPPSHEACGHSEVKAFVRVAEGRVDPAQRTEDGRTHQHGTDV